MTDEYKLLKTQKNEVFEFLESTNLEPANFSWTSVKSSLHSNLFVPRLSHRDTRFYFQFDLGGKPDSIIRREENHCCEFSPGETVPILRQFPGSWAGLLGYFVQWLNNIKREIEAPDLWAEMEKYKVAFSLAPPEQILNEPIPTYEAEKISEKLSLLADKIEEQFKLTDEQNKFVRGKLNYLAEAVKRQRSIDFVYTVIGVSVTIATALALAPDKAKGLWELMKNLMGGFIHLIGP